MDVGNHVSTSLAMQLCSILTATVHVKEAWKESVTKEQTNIIVAEVALLLANAGDVESTVQAIIALVMRETPNLELALARLNDGQRLSMMNALRNIVAESLSDRG